MFGKTALLRIKINGLNLTRDLSKCLILYLLFHSLNLFSAPGDTVTIQTFTFSDITKRRGVFQFPQAGERWQKIYMVRTLKCDVQTTHDQYPCGEWDYLTYTLIYVPIPNDTAKEIFEVTLIG